MTSKDQLYKYCQLLGWGLVSFTNLILQIMRPDSNTMEELFSAIVIVGNGIALTNLIRLVFKTHEILKRNIVVIGVATLVLAVIASLIFSFTHFCFLYMYSILTGVETDIFTVNLWAGNAMGLLPVLMGWIVSYIGVSYLLKWREAELDKVIIEKELRSAQLNTLIGQINPHFIFNGLNNIRSLMYEDVEKSRELLTALSKVLRYSLSIDKSQFIELNKEIDNVNEYMQLAKIQYEERLIYTFSNEISSNEHMIPPMVIQMLVENGLKHGISEIPEGGELKLTLKEDGRFITIEVINPGYLDNPKLNNNSTNLGVNNIKARLSLLYGIEASFSIKQYDELVISRVVIPV